MILAIILGNFGRKLIKFCINTASNEPADRFAQLLVATGLPCGRSWVETPAGPILRVFK